MRIGFDIDGVLADFNTSFIALFVQLTGKDLFGPGYFPTTWQYPQTVGYTKDEESLVWEHIKAGGTFWASLGPLDGARAFREWGQEIAPLNAPVNELYFVTSRMGKAVKWQTEYWCGEHLKFPDATVLISSEKGAIAHALNLDYYIDDRAENVLDVMAKSPNTQVYLLDAPYNRHVDVTHRIQHVSTFLTIVDRHAEALAVA